jgi:AcrR family transcriptional regulator
VNKHTSAATESLARQKTKSGRQQQRSEARRRQIFAGALDCFEVKGYHEATLIDIASSAGISTGLIYQYFDDKEDLLYQVILEILEAYNRDIPKAIHGVADPLERLQRAAIAYYKVIDKRVPAALLAYREGQSLNRDRRSALKAKELQTNNWILECIRDCEKQGYIADAIDSELATYWIISTAHAWGLKNWCLRKIISFEDYVRKTFSALLKSMLSERGLQHLETCALLDGRPL